MNIVETATATECLGALLHVITQMEKMHGLMLSDDWRDRSSYLLKAPSNSKHELMNCAERILTLYRAEYLVGNADGGRAAHAIRQLSAAVDSCALTPA